MRKSIVNMMICSSFLAASALPINAKAADVNAVVTADEDAFITKRVKEAITSALGNSAAFPDGRNIEVTTLQGQVTLRGIVSSSEEASDIKSVVEQVAGVVSVDNKLVVKID